MVDSGKMSANVSSCGLNAINKFRSFVPKLQGSPMTKAIVISSHGSVQEMPHSNASISKIDES